MCGITGFISSKFIAKDLKLMTDSLQHRGPDAEGFFFDEGTKIGLGHRRLSILDLSESANQPFRSQCGRYIMVFNGEIYNYKEIKDELTKTYPGKIQWRTTGDTEVIIEAFAAWGVDFVEKLNGMFTIAIWDIELQQLYFFRDRLGIKPLYYYKNNGEFIFASELKALTSILPKNQLKIKKNTIASFLYLGYIPNDEVIFENILKFPAGYYGVFANGNLELKSYWKAEKQIVAKTVKNEVEAKKELDRLINQSVNYRMISDVPLGVFLSGGIDSSTVAAVAQKNTKKSIKTFSIGFKENKHDESKYAKQVAEHLKTDHHEFILSKDDALARFDNLLSIYDEPYADSSAIPTLLVSEMARKHVTVALSGDGGDELFLGYGMYQWAKRLHHPLVKLSHGIIAQLLKSSNNPRFKRGALVFDYVDKKRIKSHIFSQEQYYFNETEISQLLRTNEEVNILEHYNSITRDLNPMEQQALFDLKNYLKDDLLVKVDRASMHHSLEVRVPLLDHNIVTFALNLDKSLKYRNGEMKYLLKQVLYDYVPKQIFDRPKWGFSIPLKIWLKNELKHLIDDYLNDDLVVDLKLVNIERVQKLKSEFWNGADYLYNRIWLLILLHKWVKEFKEL